MTDEPQVADTGVDLQTDLLIEDLLGDPVPPDWNDPVAVAARTAHLEAVPALAAMTTLDALAYAADARQRRLTPGLNDPTLAAATDALVGLHRAMARYGHDTLRQDAVDVVQDAMEYAVGGDTAAMVMGLIERLRRELTELMSASLRDTP